MEKTFPPNRVIVSSEAQELVRFVKQVRIAGYVYRSHYGYRIYWDIGSELGDTEYAAPMMTEYHFDERFSFGTEGPIGQDYPRLNHLLSRADWLRKWNQGYADNGQFAAYWINECVHIDDVYLRWNSKNFNEVTIWGRFETGESIFVSTTHWLLEFRWRTSDDDVGMQVKEVFGSYGELAPYTQECLGEKMEFNSLKLTRWKPRDFFKGN